MKVVREVIPVLVALITLAFGFRLFINIPALRLYHPPAIACDVVVLILIIPAILVIRTRWLEDWEAFPLLAALMAWVGFGWSLVDHVCLAGFCGFLGIAILCSEPAVIVVSDNASLWRHQLQREVIAQMTRAGIFLILAACILGPLTP